MAREYYFCSCRLDEKDHYFIWFSNEIDGVYLNSENKIIVSEDLKSLVKYAEKQKLLVQDTKPFFYNLEELENSLNNKEFMVDCVKFLDAWNLFEDVSRSVKVIFKSDRKITNKIYDKLFWGNNLPAVTPEGKSYEPVWNKVELEIIRKVLLEGIAIFRNNLNHNI